MRSFVLLLLLLTKICAANTCVLAIANAKANSQFLLQPNYSGNFNLAFLSKMEAAIKRVAQEMAAPHGPSHPYTKEEIWQWLDILAAARKDAIENRPGKAKELYGLATPRSMYDFAKYTSFLKEWAAEESDDAVAVVFQGKPFIRIASAQALIAVPNDTDPHLYDRSHADIVNQTERHQHFYPRLAALFDAGSESYLFRILKEADEFFLFHPSFAIQTSLRDYAVDLMVAALNQNNSSPTEDQLFWGLGPFYRLLTVAPPFTLGTPSILESFIEAVLRAKLHKTIAGTKIDEPFWKAVLWSEIREGRPFRFDEFLNCFTPR